MDAPAGNPSRRLPVLLLLVVVLLIAAAYLVKTQLLDSSSDSTTPPPPVRASVSAAASAAASATPSSAPALTGAALAASLANPHFKHGYDAGKAHGAAPAADREQICRTMALEERTHGYPWGAHDRAGCLVALAG